MAVKVMVNLARAVCGEESKVFRRHILHIVRNNLPMGGGSSSVAGWSGESARILPSLTHKTVRRDALCLSDRHKAGLVLRSKRQCYGPSTAPVAIIPDSRRRFNSDTSGPELPS
jgi:hypothetical protein